MAYLAPKTLKEYRSIKLTDNKKLTIQYLGVIHVEFNDAPVRRFPH